METTTTEQPQTEKKARKPRQPKPEASVAAAGQVHTRQRQVRKKVWATEGFTETRNEAEYEPVEFIFWNEEQRGVCVPYEWTDRWIRIGECKGMFYDGQKYSLPRVVYDYYKQLSTPIYANVEQEIVPGMMSRASKETGRKYRFRLEPVR